MKNTRKQYTAEFKARIVREILREEKSISELISEYGIAKTVLYRWRDQALSGLPTLFQDTKQDEQTAREHAWEQEREELYAEIGRLTTQLNWLKKKSGQCLESQRTPGAH
jgi:transposase-like protein